MQSKTANVPSELYKSLLRTAAPTIRAVLIAERRRGENTIAQKLAINPLRKPTARRLTRARAEALDLEPDVLVREAAAMTLRACNWQVVANITGARHGRDPETLHQLRVGIRRLRAVLSAYRDAIPASRRKVLGKDLRRLEHEVGDARDWDVLTCNLSHASSAEGRKSKEFAKLLRAANVRRIESYRHVRVILGNPEFGDVILRIEGLAIELLHGRTDAAGSGQAARRNSRGRRIGTFARQVLDARHRKVRKAGRAIQSLGTDELHQLRIQIKKLRYATEFFMGLWPKPFTQKYLAALRGLQDELGLIQDAASGATLLRTIGRPRQGTLGRSIASAGKWIKKSGGGAHKQLATRWRIFKRARKFW